MAYTTINKSSEHFTPHTWTGTDSNHTESIGMQPDLVWVKGRNNSTDHTLFDAVRGPFGNGNSLSSNTTAAEGGSNTTAYGGISGVTSDGFTVTAGSSNADYVNASGRTYASWNWKANGAGSANTDGSISSTVSVNTTSGFSIVKYTGTGSTATVGHGLGVAPKIVLIKTISGVENWRVYSSYLGATKAMRLNGTDAANTDSSYWNNVEPTSSVFTVGTNAGTNGSSVNMIAYCFNDVQGYSKFSSYTGNGNADGTFVYTGFAPSFILYKHTTDGHSWIMEDVKRNIAGNGYLNGSASREFYPNANNAEATSGQRFDFLSNGFKIRETGADINQSGSKFIYMAFAEAPLVGTNGVTAKAR